DRRRRLLTAIANTVQEILNVSEMLLGTSVLLWLQRAARRGCHDPAAAIQRQGAERSLKLHTAALAAESTVNHTAADRIDVHKARILVGNVEGIGRVADVLHLELAAGRADGQGRLGLHPPEDEIVEMNAPVVAQAVTVIPPPAEIPVEAVAVKLAL